MGFGPSKVAAVIYGILMGFAAFALLAFSASWIRIPALILLIYAALCFLVTSSWVFLLPKRTPEHQKHDAE
jgi:hypothetical protein